ncbi:MAG: aminotransferase class III-fold pyridoxal phosphate-dependent enzyme [bacterium]
MTQQKHYAYQQPVPSTFKAEDAFPPPSLLRLRAFAGPRATSGLSDAELAPFWQNDPALAGALQAAAEQLDELSAGQKELLRRDERELCALLQQDVLSFYGSDAASPYVPLAAVGPWIVTSHGAVLHDSAGYGMLGLGHAPEVVEQALQAPAVMANVMTPSFSQQRFTSRLKRAIGLTRPGGCPYSRFVCLNSGSESVSLAARFADLNAFRQTGPGGRHVGKPIRVLSLSGSFHGRTARAARASDSTRRTYRENLASFRDRDRLDAVAVNDVQGLRDAFTTAARQGIFYEALFLEPVLGEGQPGLALSPEFYATARELTAQADTLLVVDSIQAGLRATGYLSVVDYPGFEELPAPDIETFSKALNAGQYPLSVLALTAATAELYVTGVYGNTMTTNPRALEVGCAVLDAVDDELRHNVRARGAELKAGLEDLADELPGIITAVHGTGLMVCAEIDPAAFAVCGPGGLEESLRRSGIAMIHGGRNGLRFTPHFAISSAEVSLILDHVRAILAPDPD